MEGIRVTPMGDASEGEHVVPDRCAPCQFHGATWEGCLHCRGGTAMEVQCPVSAEHVVLPPRSLMAAPRAAPSAGGGQCPVRSGSWEHALVQGAGASPHVKNYSGTYCLLHLQTDSKPLQTLVFPFSPHPVISHGCPQDNSLLWCAGRLKAVIRPPGDRPPLCGAPAACGRALHPHAAPCTLHPETLHPATSALHRGPRTPNPASSTPHPVFRCPALVAGVTAGKASRGAFA